MSLGVLDLVFQASFIVQLVLLGLVALSIMSWAVIAYKMRELRRAQQDSEAFLEVYHAGSLDEAYSARRISTAVRSRRCSSPRTTSCAGSRARAAAR